MKESLDTKVIRHGVLISTINNRLNSMDTNHKEIIHKVSEVREKLFNGYDIKITNTNDRVSEIAEAIRRLEAIGSIDHNQVENIVHRKLIEHFKEAKDDKRWFKTHRVELLSIFTAMCMAGFVIITYIGS